MLVIPGCVGADGELRQVDYNGEATSVLNFRMAYKRLPRKGEEQEPLWISVSVWGKKAETLTPMITKGKYISVHGWLDLKTREQRDGNITEIVVNAKEVTLQGGGQSSASAKPKARAVSASDDDGSDIPFQSMTGEIILQFVDPAFDHSEIVEIGSITELSNIAYNAKKLEGAENVNFAIINAEDQTTT